jgi:transcriptional regulator with XRE-family HTH domain
MHRYRVRDKEKLRERMAASQRVVPHSVRSLATLVGVSRGTVGHLLTGEQERLSDDLAQRIAVALGVPVDDLFVPVVTTNSDRDMRVVS